MASREAIARAAAQVQVAVGAVTLAVYAPFIAILIVALPDNHEAAVGCYRHRWTLLMIRRGSVGPELTALGHAEGIIALGVHAPAAAVLIVALPGDHEGAVECHGHRRGGLITGGGGVDAE